MLMLPFLLVGACIVLVTARWAFQPIPGLAAPPRVAWHPILASAWAPTALAVVLAVLTMPFVAWSLDVVSAPPGVYPSQNVVTRVAQNDIGRWGGAAGAVLSAAIVAGALGGLVVRRHAITGALLTIALAWVTAISALPVVPALLGRQVGFSYVCLDGCSTAITSSDPGSGLLWIKDPWVLNMSPLFAPVALLVLVLGVLTWTFLIHGAPGIAREREAADVVAVSS